MSTKSEILVVVYYAVLLCEIVLCAWVAMKFATKKTRNQKISDFQAEPNNA